MKKIFLNGIKIILYVPLFLILFYLVECINPIPLGFGIYDAEWGFVDIHFWVTTIPVLLFIAFLNRFLDKKVFYKKVVG